MTKRARRIYAEEPHHVQSNQVLKTPDQNLTAQHNAPHAETEQASRLTGQQQHILSMQRSIGNAATLRRLPKPAQKSGGRLPKALLPLAGQYIQQIQRFASAEHRSLGAEGENVPESGLFPGSPALSYGEIIALSGDFYTSYDLMASPNYILKDGKKDFSPDSTQKKIAELNSLKHLFEIESIARAKGDTKTLEGLDTGFVPDLTAAPGPDGTQPELPGYMIATGGRYGEMALENFKHFSFGGENLNEWKKGHRESLEEAFKAGLTNDNGARIKAMARTAASDHYLTDAFSTGHMRVPRRPIDQYYRTLMMGATDGLVEAIVNEMPADISFKVPLSDLSAYLPDWLPSIPDIDVDIPLPLQDWVRSAVTPIAAALRPKMNDPVGKALGGLVSLWLHDKDNERGLIVSNSAGGIWKAFGDTNLDKAAGAEAPAGTNTNNRAEAQKAVNSDRDEVNKMFELGKQQASRTQPTPGGGGSTPANIPSTVLFGFDQPKGEGDTSVLSSGDQQALTSLAGYLQTVDGVKVNLTGWADSRGSQSYNTGLAGRRMSSVRAYLTAQGVAPEKLGTMNAMGEPVVATNAATHAQFRRVDVAMEGTPTPTPQPAQDMSTGPALPPGVEGPYGAEAFVPKVSSENTALEPYEWCDPKMDASLKADLSKKAREMVSGLLKGLITQNLPGNIPMDIEIPIPFMDNPHVKFEIPLKRWLSHVNDYVEPAVDKVLTDGVFGGILDGACSLAESVPQVEGGATE